MFEIGSQPWWLIAIDALLLLALVVLARRSFGKTDQPISYTQFNVATVVSAVWSVAWMIHLSNKNSITQTDKAIRFASILIFALYLLTRLTLELRNNRQEIKRLRTKIQSDSLTSLPNREIALEHLSNALQTVEELDFKPTVLHLNIDRFKSINDDLGHTAGDALLIEISKRLRDTLDQRCLIARLSGDEFVVVDTQQNLQSSR
ncbi:signaling protein YkoW [Acidimicrobiaceae bacterium]|nr:signaling protein YkoW [Acidimicrobiaceae bacterium]